MNDKWLAWMNNWELTNEENGWDEVSTNLVNFNVHFPISAIVVLKIKHAEECTIVLWVLCCHRYIREIQFEMSRDKDTANIWRTLLTLPRISTEMVVWYRFLSSFCSQFWGSIISTWLWTLLIQYTIHCVLWITCINICWKNCLAVKNEIQMNCKRCLRIQKC
jgi:hypothetical protein